MLQHSILQLCNEHIGYTHKLQILGVLCMTVDDEQQELVVKVNNTLKRVNPVNSKEGPGPQVSQAPPGIQHIAKDVNHDITRSASPSQLVVGARRSHGRKGTNPVKVQQVYEDTMDDSDEDDDEPITVIPTAPEASLLSPGSALSQSPVSLPYNPKQRMLALSEIKAFGSAKRKASQQFRVPPYSSSPSSPYASNVRSLMQDSVGSPYAVDLSRNEDGCSEDGSSSYANASTNGTTSHSQNSSRQGLSLPIYVAGTYGNDNADASHENDNSDRASSERSNPADRISNDVVTQIDGADPRDDDSEHPKQSGDSEAATNHDDSPVHGGRLFVEMDESGVRVKEEPREDFRDYDRYDYASQADTNSDDYPQNLSSRSYRNEDSRLSGTGTPERNDSIAAQVAYSGISLLGSLVSAGGSLSNRQNDGLSITYTSTGPYTVGANGRDVSNSSRIKDIIMYDDQSPLSQQKGARIETDYIVDKLGMDGRKRRRRAPEDQLTAEEIAEYLGQAADKITYSFKCKYCTDEFDDVTRYIQHTVASHQAYICHQCGKSFTTKSSLLRHRPIHTGMRRFACSICKKTFYRKDKCKAHIKRHLGTDQNVDKYTQAEQVHIEVE